jgi:hypothetical protein
MAVEVVCVRCGSKYVRTLTAPANCNIVYVCSRRDGGCGLIFSPRT